MHIIFSYYQRVSNLEKGQTTISSGSVGTSPKSQREQTQVPSPATTSHTSIVSGVVLYHCQKLKHITLNNTKIYWGTKVWNIDINFVVFKK